jgi:hypothetical protein
MPKIALPPPPPDDDLYTPETLREELLGSQIRTKVSIRKAFCELSLRHFVTARQLLPLQLYLLLAAVASGEPYNKTLSGHAWALALDRENPGAPSQVSKALSWLADDPHKLITTKRNGRSLEVFRRHEAGAGPYTQPQPKKDPDDKFFYLPFAYFTEGWHHRLKLPGTAVLLIALARSSDRVWFQLPTEHAPADYGISADTVKRGLDELRDAQLLEVHGRTIRNNRARHSKTRINDYALLGSFQLHAAAQAKAET